MSARGSREFSGLGLNELLASKEKMHYHKALKEMYELVRLETLRGNISSSESEEDYQEETMTNLTTEEEYTENSSEKSEDLEDCEPQRNRRRKQEHINAKKVYKELCHISEGLQKENQRLQRWDAELLEKKAQNELLQRKLKDYEDKLDKLINFESEKRCKETEKVFEARMIEITEESKRTKLSFKIMKQANDTIKKQNSQLEEHNKKLEEKVLSLNQRVTNLQRKNELLKKQLDEENKSMDKSAKNKEKKDLEIGELQVKKLKMDMNAYSEALSVCLEWLAETELKYRTNTLQQAEERNQGENDITTEINNERAFKILQRLSSVPSALTSSNFQLPFVKFVYWSLLHAYRNQNKKSGIPVSTYRRIGEEIYKSQVAKADAANGNTSKQHSKLQSGAFLNNSNIQIRMLSALIILKTLNQADILARVLDIVKIDTRDERGKELFVSQHGSSVVISFLAGSHKGLLNLAVDVLMQMTVESPYMSSFLESLSTYTWIKTFFELFQTKWAETDLMEKISILLQRLSKTNSESQINPAEFECQSPRKHHTQAIAKVNSVAAMVHEEKTKSSRDWLWILLS
eukprot:gene7597-8437_t